MNILEVENVSKRYDEYVALNYVSMQVREGSVFGLLGPNGAGKTSLIRIINQITAPDDGRLYFMGEPMTMRHTAYIGYLPEERGLYKKMKVGEQAVYLSMLKGLDKATAVSRLRYWFDKFGISSWWNKKVADLSKGMQQKVQFIVTIIHEPKFLIFDEPFSGFDPINANMLKEEMLSLKQKGASIIFSTHNMASVEALCDDIALINKSEKILEGSIKEIKQVRKKNIFEVSYVGEQCIADMICNDGIKVLSDICENNMHTCRMQISMEETGNHLLTRLLPYVQISEFKEVFPTMEEIFIESVTGR